MEYLGHGKPKRETVFQDIALPARKQKRQVGSNFRKHSRCQGHETLHNLRILMQEAKK